MSVKSDTTNTLPVDRQSVWEGLSGSASDPEDLGFDEEIASFDFEKHGSSPLDGSPGDDTPNEFDGIEFGSPVDDVRPPSLEPIDGSFSPIDPVPPSVPSLPIGTIAGSPIGSGIESIASSDEEESDYPSRPATPSGAIPADGIFSSDESGTASGSETDSTPESDSDAEEKSQEEPKPLVPCCKTCHKTTYKLEESGICSVCEARALWETRRAELRTPDRRQNYKLKPNADGFFHCHAPGCKRTFRKKQDLLNHILNTRTGHSAEGKPNHPLRFKDGKRIIAPEYTAYPYNCELCLAGIGTGAVVPYRSNYEDPVCLGTRGFHNLSGLCKHWNSWHRMSGSEIATRKRRMKIDKKRKRTASPEVRRDVTCC